MKVCTTSQAPISMSETILPVKDASIFSEVPFYIEVDRGNTDMEIMRVTSVSLNILTVVRAQEKTIARPHAKGTLVYRYFPQIISCPPPGSSAVVNIYYGPASGGVVVEKESTRAT